ncbi:semaphorin-4A [Syngnathus typhle]|uniref:semaphorin-4A n=1 Tax=Syngnathus typhle TaxID=161592 RepID=UPI002A69DED6|nr:semaphorin-4A [Syngnathus typhle]
MESGCRLLPIAVTLLCCLSSSVTTPTARVSFPMGNPGRRLTRFSSADVGNTTTLLLSHDGDTLFVGGRDIVLELDVSLEDTIMLRNKLDWKPSDKDLEQCSMKGKKMTDCPNFIRVLLFLNATHLYACGTFAFSPRCIYINSDTLTMSLKADEGRGRCPYDPYQRNTAIIVDGELYTGTVADYRGNWPLISRHLSEGSRVDLKLDDTLGWLEDPTFISSTFIPDEGKIYFFFSEVGREYDFVDKFIVSRVSQVCTSDVGGQRTLQRRWTTFAKAQLLCQAYGELPYNVIQDIDSLAPTDGATTDDTLFYGIFTSQWSINSGLSAVCSFRLADIRSAFSGSYKVLNRDTLQWSTRVQERVANPGQCGLHNASDNALRFVKENFLADDSVRPAGGGPTMVSTEHRYSHLAVQRVRATDGVDYTVLFLLTESGYLHKAVLLQSGAHVVEEVQVFLKPQPVKSLKLSIPKGLIYVGTSEGVLRLPTANCSFYWTCAQCVLARDPFCGWDAARQDCVGVSGTHLGQDVERGNVEKACESATSMHRARFGPSNLPAAPCPAGEQLSVSLHEVVRLACPAASRLSRQSWERPNSRLSPELYLHLDDGSLSFVATPATLGHYLCLSAENGFRQTMAVYHVKQKSGPLPSPKGPTQPGHNFSVWMMKAAPNEAVYQDGDSLLSSQTPSYLKELVAVSVLLVLCLSVLFTILLYVVRERWHSRTVPQQVVVDSGRRTPEEQEALQVGPAQSKRNGHVEGTLSNGAALAASNGHLPNTPI